MGKGVSVTEMANAIMEGMYEYADVTSATMKSAVKATATSVKKDIQKNAPTDTGRYKKSWATKKTAEGTNSVSYTVYSKDRYQLAHLLENGHAKRGGGRVEGKAHIAPAANKAEKTLKSKIKGGLT